MRAVRVSPGVVSEIVEVTADAIPPPHSADHFGAGAARAGGGMVRNRLEDNPGQEPGVRRVDGLILVNLRGDAGVHLLGWANLEPGFPA